MDFNLLVNPNIPYSKYNINNDKLYVIVSKLLRNDSREFGVIYDF